jgi:hypothetical protein
MRTVFHAGCGEVKDERTPGSRSPILMCQKCRKQIVDPRELAPRGTGFVPDPDAPRDERYRLEA